MTDRKIKLSTATSKTLLHKMQELHFVLAMVEQLRGGMAIRVPIEKIREVVDALLREMPYLGYPVPHSFSIFRGRIENNSKTLKRTVEFSYRPIEQSKAYGRCHTPGHTIFYGASNLDTVLSELMPEIGDNVHIGVATISGNSKVIFTAIGEIDYIRRYERPLIGNEESIATLQRILMSHEEQRRIRTILIDAFFSDIFAAPASKQRDYKVTSTLSELLLEAKNEKTSFILDGFAYPSVAHRGGLNFAIQPHSFDSKFKWANFMAFEITDYLGFGLYGRRQYAKADKYRDDKIIKWEDC